ncbi:MAG: Bug family tripartite tricarboxylate transporter substrate binding protein [Burkholderiales bacterium]
MRRLLLCLSMTIAAALPIVASAQTFPSRPIRFIVPYPSGGPTDLMARALQEPIQKAFGQPVVVENRAGAAGLIGTREAMRSAPDGHTLLFFNNGILSVTPFVVKDVGFDGMKDFAPVALASTAPLVIVTHPTVPVNDLRGFIDWARRQDPPIELSSSGIGSSGHLAGALFARMAGIKTNHIPYKGQAPMTTALLAGEVRLVITSGSTAMNGFIASNKLKLLAVTSTEPTPLMPGAPTATSVLPGYVVEVFFGFLAPAGTPADVITRLNEAFGRALETPEMRERFAGFGVRAAAATPRRLGEMIAEDITRWSTVIRENNIRPE